MHFFVFVLVLTLTTSTSALLYQLCMPSCCIRAYHTFCMSLQVVTGRMYVILWLCLHVKHVGDSTRMACDWLIMRQNQLKVRQSRQIQQAGQWQVPERVICTWLFVSSAVPVLTPNCCVYLFLPKKNIFSFVWVPVHTQSITDAYSKQWYNAIPQLECILTIYVNQIFQILNWKRHTGTCIPAC